MVFPVVETKKLVDKYWKRIEISECGLVAFCDDRARLSLKMPQRLIKKYLRQQGFASLPEGFAQKEEIVKRFLAESNLLERLLNENPKHREALEYLSKDGQEFNVYIFENNGSMVLDLSEY